MLGDNFLYSKTGGGCVLQIKVARDRENIFHFELYVNIIQSNLDYSKCQRPQESFRIIGSSNDRNQEFSDIFGKTRMLS